jgi:hypothetical protein
VQAVPTVRTRSNSTTSPRQFFPVGGTRAHLWRCQGQRRSRARRAGFRRTLWFATFENQAPEDGAPRDLQLETSVNSSRKMLWNAPGA